MRTHEHRTDRTGQSRANPLGAVGVNAALTGLALFVLLDFGLPLAASLGAAWIGGAIATVAALALITAQTTDGAAPATSMMP